MFTFPSGTRSYHRPKPGAIFSNGRIIPIEFLCYLSDLALNLSELDTNRIDNLSSGELDTTIWNLQADLDKIASLVPPEWISGALALPMPDVLFRYIFHYVTIRVHLPLVLKPERSSRAAESQAACKAACHAVARFYLALYPLIPVEFFLNRIATLQVFTAMVILLLMDHSVISSGVHAPRADVQEESTTRVISRVLERMELSMTRNASGIIGKAVETIKSLINLLERDDPSRSEDLVLNVPLLGKLRVKHRQRTIANSALQQDTVSRTPQGLSQLDAEAFLNQKFGLSSAGGSASSIFWSIEEVVEPWFYEMVMTDDYVFPVSFHDTGNKGS
jgi:hypothetical protein